MSEEASNDPDSKEHAAYVQLGRELDVGFVGSIIEETIGDIRQEIDDRLASIGKLVPYLTNSGFADAQRQHAARDLFRIQAQLAELHQELVNTLVMVPDLGYPVNINT